METCDHIDGVMIDQAAYNLGVTVDEVWRQVKNGRLMARTDQGRVMVYSDIKSETVPAVHAQDTCQLDDEITVDDLPALQSIGGPPPLRQGAEVALFLDHLSLAKEENREILRLTQDSMAKFSQMTDRMLEMKDAMIAARDEQLSILKGQLSEQAEQVKKLLKDKEDLETLARALQL